jgi:hypothetical protein
MNIALKPRPLWGKPVLNFFQQLKLYPFMGRVFTNSEF